MAGGFLITSGMNREDKAFKEFMSKVVGFGSSGQKRYTNISNFGVLLKDELTKLKTKQNFIIQEKYKSLLIVRNETESTSVEIFKWMRKNGILFKNILRVVPLDILGRLDVEIIKKYVFEKKRSGSFKILYEGRLCQAETKNSIFGAVIRMIDSPVNLSDPDWMVVVEVFKSIVGLSVVESDDRNFNFAETYS